MIGTIAAVATMLLVAPGPARPAEAGIAEAARAAMGRFGPALVIVRLTVKTRVVYEGREQAGPESTTEVQGTVVAPDGLTVLSDFSTNPAALFQREGGPQLETETTDVKLVLQDGRELPARFVLRDTELDLAFVAPLEPASALPAVRFEKGTVPALMDELVFLGQLGKSLGREVAVTAGRVRAVVKKPRTFVVPSSLDGLNALGGPAIDAKGRPVGLVVLRRTSSRVEESSGLRDLYDAMAAVVVTAADIQAAAAQAAAARDKPAG